MSKILVVDDELNICELLKLYLENEGYTVFTANDGQAAVTAFQQKAPDLVLLDIMLPKMDGWQVCREIRKTRCWDWSWALTTMWSSPLTPKRWWPG